MIAGASHDSIARCASTLLDERAPLFVLGPGANRCVDLVVALARGLGAAIVTTPDAKGLVDERLPEAGGNYSFGGSELAMALAEAAGLVVAVGTSLFEFASGGGRLLKKARIVHIGEDAMDIPIAMSDGTALVGDLREILVELARAVGPVSRERWFEGLRAPANGIGSIDDSPYGIHPVAVARAIEAALPSPSRVVCDITTLALPLLERARLGPDRRCHIQIEKSATLGSTLMMGLGVRLASRCPTVLLVGEWGLLFSEGELSTVSMRDVGQFVVVCGSNSGSAMIRAGVEAQKFVVPAEVHTWNAPRFDRVAAGHGLHACRVTCASDLEAALSSGLRATHPVLIDALIDPNAKVPATQARFGQLDEARRPR